MIICNSRKFIFAKNLKVGSTTTEVFLNDILDKTQDIWYGVGGLETDKSFNGYNNDKGSIHAHIPIYKILTPETKNYYKVITERNPWDQYVSLFDFQTAKGTKPLSPKLFFYRNYNIYMRDKISMVDKIIRYENLKTEIQDFCEKLNVPFEEEKWDSMNYKTSTRKNTTTDFYIKYPDKRELVRAAAWFHINMLGYEDNF